MATARRWVDPRAVKMSPWEIVSTLLRSVADFGCHIEVQLEGLGKGRTVLTVQCGEAGPWNPAEPASLFPSYEEDLRTGYHLHGRQGGGLRELATQATYLEVEGGGHLVTCAEQKVEGAEESEEAGLRIAADLPWEPQQARLLERSLMFVQYEHGLTVNGEPTFVVRDPDDTMRASLETVRYDGVDELRIERETHILVWAHESGREGQVLEMGFPVAASGQPVTVDVGQRIPMTEKREVEPLWLDNVMMRALDRMVQRMEALGWRGQ